jgi:propionyl-CoA synthetase
VIAEHGAVALFTAPTAFRAIKKEDPDGKLSRAYDLSGFRHALFSRAKRRPRYGAMGREDAGVTGDRPLVADRETGWPSPATR